MSLVEIYQRIPSWASRRGGRQTRRDGRDGDSFGAAGPAIGDPTDIAGLRLWLRADLGATTVQGPVVATGTTPPTVTLSGTPASTTNSIEIDITTLGVLGVAPFSWKLNGVTQQTAQVTAASFPLAGTGITASFSAGNYAADNVYKSVVTVSAWADQSGGGFNVVQATAANQPAFTASDGNFSNTPTLLFSGSQWLKNTLLSLTQPFTVYTLLKLTASTEQVVFGIAASNPPYIVYDQTGAFWGINAPVTLTSTSSSTGPLAMASIFNGGTSQINVNSSGTPVAAGAAGSTNLSGGCQVGIYGNLANFGMQGSMSEVLAYSGAHSSAQIAQVFAYMARRTGVQAS